MEHSQDVKSVAWHPTLNILASCSYDDSIKLYLDDPSDDWFPFATLTAHGSTVWDVAWSPCGKFFASVSDDRSIRIWRAKGDDLKQWETIQVVENAHDRPIYSAAWGKGIDSNPNSRGWLATTGGDGKLNIWSVIVREAASLDFLNLIPQTGGGRCGEGDFSSTARGHTRSLRHQRRSLVPAPQP